ncbi:MAG TPA: ATP-binding protein [Acidobacteriaceae bacterium]|jgi:two-component system sensor histidine kinase CpxA
MTMRIRSLFLKIFFWFWITVIATGFALVVTWIILQPENVPSQWQTNLADTAWASGTAAVNELEQQGTSAAAAYMEQFNHKTHLKTCLFDASGNIIAGTDCSNFDTIDTRAMTSEIPAFTTKHNFVRIAVKVRGKSGRPYIYVLEQATEHRGPPPGIGLSGILLRWSVPLLVSGFICYLLTRYLTAPILRLREASQQLAQGDFSTRAAGMERRRDELGWLVRDFNAMAGRIEELVSRQRQLIYDISHELRSPLARLNVALDLGRERKGNDSAFDHMEQDLECLNDMIARLLTVARLDTSDTPVPMAYVDLTELVSQIVRGADFELQKRGGAVRLSSQGDYFVQGNAELLHGAIENVVRNAIRYTGAGNSVEVQLESAGTSAPVFVRLLVHDYGPGVPEPELVNIFQPFYRVADDRNRESGGTGLGLAIAERVVRIHGGSIRARNAEPRGLQVEILLPQAAPVNSPRS